MLSINAQAYINGVKNYRNIYIRGSIASKWHQKGKKKNRYLINRGVNPNDWLAKNQNIKP